MTADLAIGFLIGFVVCALLTSTRQRISRGYRLGGTAWVGVNPPKSGSSVVLSKGGVNRSYQITERPPDAPPIPRSSR